MIDLVALLTPLLVFAVVALFGFAGCSFDPRAAGPPDLSIRVRVPTALTVTEILYGSIPPGGTETPFTDPNPTAVATEDGDNVFLHSLGAPLEGAWTAACRVTVSQDGASDQDFAQGEFLIDGTNDLPRADFQATGTPAGGDFIVVFAGLS